MNSKQIAQVIVDVPTMQVDRPFDYAIPTSLTSVVKVGMRVIVPFGNRKVQGFVIGLKNKTEISHLKKIVTVMDLFPVLNEELLELGDYLAASTLTFRITAYQAMLPPLLRAQYEKCLLLFNKENAELNAIFAGEERLSWKKAEQGNHLKTLQKHLRLGNIEVDYQVKNKITQKTVQMIKVLSTKEELAEKRERLPKNATSQQRILLCLIESGEKIISKKELKQKTGCTDAALKRLATMGLISFIEQTVARDPYQNHAFKKSKPFPLLPAQKEACRRIFQSYKEENSETFLLHGVTGSGKTEIYLQSIASILADGKEAIVLVSEISLTPQMVERFKSRFGEKVAVLHSALSSGEKYDEWRKIERKEAKVVVGARSAVFAPFENIGLIIIDEEHESSYKQEDNPRYHARDVAIWRAKRHKSPVVFGSATPALESFARAKKGVYTLIELPERVNNQPLPPVQVIDMRKELRKGNRNEFSTDLLEKIKERVANKEQIVLLLNKRGYASFVMCRDCGHVIGCPNCDISLTYHQFHHKMKCHYCGHEEAPPTQCPSCKSVHIRQFGTGTQKIEESLTKLIPEARVIRMDVDTTRRKGAHEKLLSRFKNRQADILLGTQMIAKGLDFPNVTLVGVLNADTMLFLPDFRAAERTFQLLTQVSGRTGRHKQKGEVIIQTYRPDHYSITFTCKHDYPGFYEYEMKMRAQHHYPPFYYLTLINVSHENEMKAIKTIENIAQFLRTKLKKNSIILGPVPSPIPRLKNKYRYQCMIKYKSEPHLNDELKQLLEHYQKEMPKGLGIMIDVQPFTLL